MVFCQGLPPNAFLIVVSMGENVFTYKKSIAMLLSKVNKEIMKTQPSPTHFRLLLVEISSPRKL
jgi:hypothetical protein